MCGVRRPPLATVAVHRVCLPGASLSVRKYRRMIAIDNTVDQGRDVAGFEEAGLGHGWVEDLVEDVLVHRVRPFAGHSTMCANIGTVWCCF